MGAGGLRCLSRQCHNIIRRIRVSVPVLPLAPGRVADERETDLPAQAGQEERFNQDLGSLPLFAITHARQDVHAVPT